MKNLYRNIYGIIINIKNFGECGKIITLLDSNLGRVQFFSFGSSKEISRKRSNLITSNIITGILVYNFKKDYFTLKEISTIASFENITKNINKLSFLFFFFEILNNLVPERHSIDYFNIIENTLYLLNNEEDFIKYILFSIFFIYRKEGIFPDINKESIENYIKHLKNKNNNEIDIVIGKGSNLFLKDIFKYNDIYYFKNKRLSNFVISELIILISRIYEYYFDKELNSLSLLLTNK